MARQLLRRRGVLLGVGLYALVLLSSPALHHDLACHLQSPTHCTACTSAPVAASEDHCVRLDGARLPEAGRTQALEAPSHRAVALLPTTGRSPPL